MRFDDLRGGERFPLGEHRMDASEIVRFAEAYDPQPFHLSEAGAAANPLFERPSASGWHVALILNGMLGRLWQARGLEGLAGAGIDELTWVRPVYADDVLTGSVEVIEARQSASKPERGVMKMRGTLINQDRDTVLILSITGIFLR